MHGLQHKIEGYKRDGKDVWKNILNRPGETQIVTLANLWKKILKNIGEFKTKYLNDKTCNQSINSLMRKDAKM